MSGRRRERVWVDEEWGFGWTGWHVCLRLGHGLACVRTLMDAVFLGLLGHVMDDEELFCGFSSIVALAFADTLGQVSFCIIASASASEQSACGRLDWD